MIYLAIYKYDSCKIFCNIILKIFDLKNLRNKKL